jgi:hypothetical protein
MRDPWLERRLARPEVRARLQQLWLLVQLSTLLALAAGGLVLILLIAGAG